MIPVLAGPTASGKSAVAHALARLHPIEIIAADSRTVYRGLDIGTAKPTKAERAAIPYHGLDLVEPAERYAAGRFAQDAAAWLAAITQRGRTPLVVGGTGFYLRALFEGLFEEPPLDATRRDRLRPVLRALGRDELARWALRLDPDYRGGRNTQRAARTVEVSLMTGRPLSRLQRQRPASGAGTPRYARLTLPREVLLERITRRTRAMLDAGLVEEVRGALAHGVSPEAPGLTGVGYREVVALFKGRLGAGDLEAAIVQATRQYAKRQETWFRHQLPADAMVLDATQPPEALASQLLSYYQCASA